MLETRYPSLASKDRPIVGPPGPAGRRQGRSANSPDDRAGGRPTSLVLLAWWLFQVLPSYIQPYILPPDDASMTTETGSLLGTVSVVWIGLLGLWFLPRGIRSLRARELRPFMLFLVAYLAWSLLSLLWTIDPALTIRRYSQFALLVIGAMGLGLGFYGTSAARAVMLLRHVVVAGVIAMLAVWLHLASSGNLDLMDPAWSAKGYASNTLSAYPIGYAIAATVYLRSVRSINGALFRLVLLSLGFTLLAQKVRVIAASVFVVSGLLFSKLQRSGFVGRKAVVVLLLLALAGILLLSVGLSLSVGVRQSLDETVQTYATLGAGSSGTESLTGRMPLWEDMAESFRDRPLWGYGFGAFWTPDNLLRVWSRLHWRPPHGHSGFFDEALGTGLIGLTLFLGLWFSGIRAAYALSRRADYRYGWLVILWMVLFLLLNAIDSIMQLYFQFPFYVTLAALFTLVARGTARESEARAPRRRADRPLG